LSFMFAAACLSLTIATVVICAPEAKKDQKESQEQSASSRGYNDLREEIMELGKSGDPAAFEKLAKYAHDNDEFARRMAAVALGRSSNKEAFDLLVTLSHDKEAKVRAAAAFSIGIRHDVRSYAILADMIDKDESNEVKGRATFALGNVRGDQAKAKLQECFDSPLMIVRENAAKAVERKHDAWVVEPLIKALRDPAEEVRRAALKSLAGVTGQDALYEKTRGRSAEEIQSAWQEWWTKNKNTVKLGKPRTVPRTAKEWISQYDTDKNGMLDEKELQPVLYKLFGSQEE